MARSNPLARTRVLLAFCFSLVLALSLAPTPSRAVCYQQGALPFPVWRFMPPGQEATCLPGFHCPFINPNDNSTWPEICPPSPSCTQTRYATDFCEPQGSNEPRICPAGSYCPRFDVKLPCPEGYYCPIGTVDPIQCEPLSLCPEGSDLTWFYGAFVAVLLTDLAVAALAYVDRRRQKSRHEELKRMDLKSSVEMAVIDPSTGERRISSFDPSKIVPQPGRTAPPLATQILCDNFARARATIDQMTFDFKELSLAVPMPDGTKKTILTGVTGSIRPGKVTAVMGPSGAGKTTFLNTLMGKVDDRWPRGGSLRINGEEAKSLSKYQRVIGYVPQDDVMHRELTVWQNVQYSADVRLPRSWTATDRILHCRTILEALNLVHVLDVPVGDEQSRGISGGQRKRVNIAMELAPAPVALFLDEPTSGLDSTAALEVCNMLKDIAAATNMTVTMVIHQPRYEIWNSLDEVLLLAPGGRTVYQGPQRLALAYFERHLGVKLRPFENPADVIMDEVSKRGPECADFWISSGKSLLEQMVQQDPEGENKKVVVSPSKKYLVDLEKGPNTSVTVENVSVDPDRGASFFRQVYLSHARALRQQSTRLGALILECAVSMFGGLIMGAAGQNVYQGIFVEPYTMLSPSPRETLLPQYGMYIGMTIGIASATAGVKVFGEEQVIYWREKAAGHNALAYYIGVTTSMFYRFVVIALHFAAIYVLLGRPSLNFGDFFIVCLLLYYAVYGLAAMISMILKRENAPLLAGVIAIFAAVFNGYVGILPTVLKKASYVYWATEALFGKQLEPFSRTMRIKDVSADIWGYSLDAFGLDLAMIFVIGTIYRMISYVCMVYLHRDKQR